MKKIAVYGSLKKGFYNYRESMGEPIGHSTIMGEMYLAHSYPHLYRPEVSNPELVREHPVEIYEISDESYAGIERMELGAGYQVYPQTLVDKDSGVVHDVVIFYSKDNHSYKSNWISGYNKETVPHALRC